MSNPSSKWEVNIAVVMALASLPVIANAVTKVVDIVNLEWGGYFSYSEFLYSYPEKLPFGAVLIQIAIPVVIGLLSGMFPIDNPKGTAASGAAIGTFLVVWPIAWLWDSTGIIQTPMGGRKYAFISIFILHMIAASYLAITGLRAVTCYQTWMRNKKKEAQFSLMSEVFDWEKSVRPAVIAAATAIGTIVLTSIFSK